MGFELPRLFILGAGFSAAAGLPVSVELLDEVLAEVGALNNGDSHLHRSLDDYRSFVEATTGTTPDPIDIEDFAAYLDHQHAFGMLGGDTWSQNGNRDQFLLRWGIGRVLHRATPAVDELPPAYRAFASWLRPRDVLITFNYDMLPERLLEDIGLPYRRFPNRFTEVGPLSTIDSDAEEDEVLILKMHGSIDWVDRRPYDRACDYSGAFDEATRKLTAERDQIFGIEPVSPVHPLLEGPVRPDDPLQAIYVMEDLTAYYDRFLIAFHHPPVILAPSQAKQLYGEPLRQFWDGLTRWGNAWSGIGIIGYSIPPADPYSLQALYGLTSGYLRALDKPRHRIGDMRRLVLVDRRLDETSLEELRARYRFLLGAHVDLHVAGFDLDAVELLFQAPAYQRHDEDPEPCDE